MTSGSSLLLLLSAVTVAVLHSVLPDHWVPLAVVARTQTWSRTRVARVSALAAAGHVAASLVLAGAVAVVGLKFQAQIDLQQGHIVGGLLVFSGIGLMVWGWTGRGQAHGHEHHEGDHDDHEVEHHGHHHDRGHLDDDDHQHEHAHADLIHSHPHSHDAYIASQSARLRHHSANHSLAGTLATIAVPFGVAASPDLTILPIALGASSYGPQLVAEVLGLFALVTLAVFVGLTVIATAIGYQIKGEWLETHANTFSAGVLIAIGVVAYLGY